MFSITSGAELYILNILKPLVGQCRYSVTSTMVFSNKFKENSHKLNRFYEVVSFDAANLFTSINVPRVVDYIVEKIYENPTDFFPINSSENFPPQNFFKEFLLAVLLKYSAFWTLNGYYRQKCGLSMGSKLSPAISNIFLNMLESVTIKIS